MLKQISTYASPGRRCGLVCSLTVCLFPALLSGILHHYASFPRTMALFRHLRFEPTDVTEHENTATAVQTVYDALDDHHDTVFGELPDEIEPMRAFIAVDPACALRWICQRTLKDVLLKVIKELYDALHPTSTEEETPAAALGTWCQSTARPHIRFNQASQSKT